MSDLIRTNRGKNRSSLDRGKEIKPSHMVTPESFEKSSVLANSNIRDAIPDSVTFDITARINNHIRNKYTALIGIGIGNNMKESMDILLDYYIDGLPEDQARMVRTQLSILEKRDVQKRSPK